MHISERELLIALHHIPGIGPHKWHQLNAQDTSTLALLETSGQNLITALGANGADLFNAWRKGKKGNWLQARLDVLSHWLACDRHCVITRLDPQYPALLTESHGPLLLHVDGNPDLLNLPQIAMVGSRKPTAAGRKTAHSFAEALARGGFVITSGLALGIDTAAHTGALSADGLTVAVLGSGLKAIYPASNKALADRICAGGGALVSEFALDVRPEAGHFPRRNRIISGLSLGTLVVEAALKSGSLITARLALEQNREVFAVPGSVHSPVSAGCHWLIREGATLVDCPSQIAEQLGSQLGLFDAQLTEHQGPLSLPHTLLLEAMGLERIALEELLESSPFNLEELLQHLSEMETRGLIQSSEMGYERVV